MAQEEFLDDPMPDIDEGTAVIVQGDRFEVMGDSKVAIYDGRAASSSDGRRYYFLSPGDVYNLKTRSAERR